MSVTKGPFTNWNIINYNNKYAKIQKYDKTQLKKEFLRMAKQKEITFLHRDRLWVKSCYW